MNKSKIITIATCVISCVGTGATAYFAVKDSQKEMKLPETNTRIGKIKYNIKRYWRTYLIGGLTMSSNIAGSIYSINKIGSLTASVVGLSASYRKLKDSINDQLTDEQKQELISKLSSEVKNVKNDRSLYYSDYTGVFAARPEDVAVAYKKINDVINDPREERKVYIKDFLKNCKAELHNEYDFLPYADFGWEWGYLEDRYDNDFVHMVEFEEAMSYYGYDENHEQYAIYVNVLKFKEEPIYMGE